MDFLTVFPYVGIVILVVINAFLVINRKITLDKDKHDHHPGH